MNQVAYDNADLTRGHKEYDSNIKNIEGIFTKLEGILDMSKYKEEYENIIIEVKKDKSFNNKMTFDNFQMDYED